MTLATYGATIGVAGCFGYDAVKSTPRRKAPISDLRNSDEQLRWHERDKLVSTTRDAKRNYAVAAWMIRKHVDFVSDFHFQPNTPDDQFNAALKGLMLEWSQRKKCHVGQRHPLRRLIRIVEACRTMDGDCLIELIKAGSINVIRGDRIRNPQGSGNSDEWVHGVQLDPSSRAKAYQVHKRTRAGTFTADKIIPARNAILHGYFDDGEQIRGVSPLTTSINNLRDTYEGVDFALARMKAEQILGFAITKLPPEGFNPFQGNQTFTADEDDTEEVNAAESKSGLVDYGSGIWQTELEPGEDIKSVAGNMPSSNAQNFIAACIHMALKSLDIPVSFWDESHTNFFGSRGALQLYKRSCANKQEDNQELLDEISDWKILQWIIDGRLTLPRGWTIGDIEYMWVPRGIPWWDRSKEIIGDMRAIGAALDNPIDICLDHGMNDPFENIDKTAKVAAYAAEKLGPFGMSLNLGVTLTDEEVAESKESTKDEKENKQ